MEPSFRLERLVCLLFQLQYGNCHHLKSFVDIMSSTGGFCYDIHYQGRFKNNEF